MNFLMVSWELRDVVQVSVGRISATRFRREEGSALLVELAHLAVSHVGGTCRRSGIGFEITVCGER